MRIFAYLWRKGGNRIVMKFCIRVGVPDLITHANLGDDRFRGFWRSGEEGVNFPLFHWLALSSLKHSGTTVPTLALPCQRVMSYFWPKFQVSFINHFCTVIY